MESGETTPPAGELPLTSDQIRRATFPQALRGYDREAVHAMLDRVADSMEAKATAAYATPAVRDELTKIGERTAGILTAAEEAAANLRDEAKHYAIKIRADADDESRKARLNASQQGDEMIADAETKAQRIIDDAVARRRELNQAISSLLERRDEIATDTVRLAEELMEAVEALRSSDPRAELPDPEPLAASVRSRPEPTPAAEREPESESEEVTLADPEPTSDEFAMAEPPPGADGFESSEPEPEPEPDSDDTALFALEPDSDDTETLERDSDESEAEPDSEVTYFFKEPETGEVPQGPSRLLVDPEGDDTPPQGLPR